MSSRKPSIRLFNNWPAKVISIALALILFVFHRMSTLTTRSLSVPLVVETSSALVPSSSYPQSVRIQIRGEDDSIKSISDGDIEAVADFRKYEAKGLYRAPIQIRKKGSALSIEPLEVSVTPLEISIYLDNMISKTIPITADIRGMVAPGFDFVEHTISPVEIVVSGPMSILEDVMEIKTDPINLDGRRSDFGLEVYITKDNPFLMFRGSGMVEFQGFIRPSVPVRDIEGIPIAFAALGPSFHADLSGKTGSIRLEGNHAQLDTFSPAAGLLSVDCSRISEPGTYRLPVKVDLPIGLFLIRQDPEEMTVVVTLREEGREAEGIPLEH